MKTNWQEQLHTLLNCDLKELYPLARSMNRKLKFFVGPTNSGKTYAAMKISRAFQLPAILIIYTG